jgi:hypothetical protein
MGWAFVGLSTAGTMPKGVDHARIFLVLDRHTGAL